MDNLPAERRMAVMQIKQGKTQEEVAAELKRSPAWVAKWYGRFKQKGWAGLKEESRAPKNHGQRTPPEVKQAVCRARMEIEAEAALGQGLKYKGARSVRTRLMGKVAQLPSIPTIERILREAQLTQPRTPTPEPKIFYPRLRPTEPHHLHQVDIAPHYLQGGERAYCFNGIDVVSRYPTGLALPQHRAQDAANFLLHVWQEMGVAAYTQVDNEGCFSGGSTHPHVLGQVARLALTVGTELVFSPVYHPQSNGYIERFHQDYDQHVWRETYLENLETVNQNARHFFALYREREDHGSLNGRSPSAIHQSSCARQLPTDFALPAGKLPLREGRIHFIRRVNDQGMVRVLNVDWKVPTFDVDKGVWATIEFQTTGAFLSIFDDAPDAPERNCLATYPFPLNEPVLPFNDAVDAAAENQVSLAAENESAAEANKLVEAEAVDESVAHSLAAPVSKPPNLPGRQKLPPLGHNLLIYTADLAFTALELTSRFTRQTFSTMY
jgi:transposase InsO family protein